jgi:hypothetical protein
MQDRRYDRRRCGAANPGQGPEAVAKRSSRRRVASRKRSAATAKPGAPARAPAKAPAEAEPTGGKRATLEASSTRRARERAARGDRGHDDIRAPGALGERPEAPWHPLPLSELLILVGMIGTIVGYTQGESGRAVLFAGIGSVLLGTLEFTIREHLSGYRSHASLLAALPTALLHGVVALTLFAFGAPTQALVIAPLLLDVPVFSFLFRLLRARFKDARRERVSTGRR